MRDLLELKNVSKHFGGLRAVDNVSFCVEEAKIHGLIGPNGSGKTTIFNLITGVLPLTSGCIRFRGIEITNLPAYKINRLGIARTFQNLRMFKTMTIWESVLVAQNARYGTVIAAAMPFKTRKEAKYRARAEELLEQYGLWDRRFVLCSDLSLGEQRWVDLIRALATEPILLLLDEPTAGLTRIEVEKWCDLIEHLCKKDAKTILLVEHNMHVALKCSEHVIVLNFGRKIAEGRPEEIVNNPVVIEAYLGAGSKSEVCERGVSG
ncbi:MAG: ABC transporter ATP-binding protein [Candidatus Methanomethyliaceae archaeon]